MTCGMQISDTRRNCYEKQERQNHGGKRPGSRADDEYPGVRLCGQPRGYVCSLCPVGGFQRKLRPDPGLAGHPNPRHFDSQAPYKINTLSESAPNYWQAEWETQVYNYKMVRNYPTLYTQDAWDAAQSAGTVMMGLHPESLTDANKQQILKARDAIAALADHQLKPYSDGINGEVIYLWGDDMPVTTLAEDLQFPLVNYEGESVYDNADFQPFLIPYLLDDPSSAKGTIIVASGGGNTSRSNPVEAYAVCPEFNKLGYNCFLLQRRVAPYNNDDIVMDMQRAVRMVKYYSDQWGIDLEGSLLAVSGYSGSGGNIRTMLEKFYGNITPSQFDPDYVCDAVDAVNSDVDVAHLIYSGAPIETENPNLPHMFIAVGADDQWEGSLELFKQTYDLGLDPELHVYGLNGHGFGAEHGGHLFHDLDGDLRPVHAEGDGLCRDSLHRRDPC